MKEIKKFEKKSVTIITGFLGAGKTTFLNALLTEKHSSRYAIIENEVGSVNIDSNLIVKSEEQIVELSNGCLCCSLNKNFIEILHNLVKRTDDWDELVIEATGVADPEKVIYPFLAIPAVQNVFQLQNVVSIVDSKNFLELVEKESVLIRQLVWADVVICNKSDLVAEEVLLKLQNNISDINPNARIVSGSEKGYPLVDIFSECGDFVSIQNKQSKDNQHSSIKAQTLKFEGRFDLDTLKNRLQAFMVFQSGGVYRLKGFVSVTGHNKKFIVQGVMRSVIVSESNVNSSDELSSFVIIGENITGDSYRKMLEQCQV